MSEWKQQKFELNGDPKTQMNALAGTIDAEYDEGLLERLVRNGGLDDGDASVVACEDLATYCVVGP